ncbi:MAG: tripartite tricarboxylate transporter TctB family protein [Betaproteobacteria bacterium]|nr:tripartite tricarboxylate transporter TctB family protein [Betaproteobacteria bacterium]
MKLSADARIYLFVLAVALFMVAWSLVADYRFESKILPVLVGGIVVLLATAGLWNEVRAHKPHEAASDAGSAFARESWRGYSVHFGWLAGFLLAIYFVGYHLAIPIFVFLYTRRLGSGFLPAAVSALTVSVFIYAAFELALEVKLYRGLVFAWLS